MQPVHQNIPNAHFFQTKVFELLFFGHGSQIDKTGTEPVGANRLSSSFIDLRSMTEEKQALIIENVRLVWKNS